MTALGAQNGQDQGAPFRVMVVDDSAIIRGFLSRYLTEDPQINVITTANNGVVALRQLETHDVEVVVLDIEMPEMDGLTALPKMLEMKPDLQVVMASTLTRKNADISMRSLSMGAVDYVPKPETARSVNANIDFRRELVEKVKAWASRRRKRRGEGLPKDAEARAPQRPTSEAGRLSSGFVSARRPARPVQVVTSSARSAEEEDLKARNEARANKTITLRPASKRKPKILAIGSSTGGPQALMTFFKQFSAPPEVPVVIVQHMPATFTAILAEHLKQATGWPAMEASDNIPAERGHIYVAPGGKHMVLEGSATEPVIRLDDGPPENFCKPAVDPMFRSLVPLFGDAVLATVLTGMGHDGLKGGRDLTRAGATLVAQDEATSVVWGMPGAVATAGLCSEVSPLEDLGKSVVDRLKRGV